LASSDWAIDLGTTNTRIARWDPAESRPRLLVLDRICRPANEDDPLDAPRLIPSATHLLDPVRWRDRAGAWPILDGRFLIGRQALIGQPAIEKNLGVLHPNFAPGFKLPLMRGEALRPLVRVNGRSRTVRQVARSFYRELLMEVRRSTGERIRDVTLTVPVEAYETYRAELAGIARSLGAHRVGFIDEPVAAALGYGLSLVRGRLVLVVDFGGGTLHLVVVVLAPAEAETGTGKVLAKTGRLLGGDMVDQWLLDQYCQHQGFEPLEEQVDEETRFWHRQMLAEARRVKETLFLHEAATFRLVPPVSLRAPGPPVAPERSWEEVTRAALVELLHVKGVYRVLEECLQELEAQCQEAGCALKDMDDVLLVGGSTLLPGVYKMLEERFGRDRLRAWQPFEAVAYGACAFAAGSVSQSDFIVHDYAFVTHDPRTREPQYTVVVPRNTRFPTVGSLWRGQLVPTCSLGEPERLFKLVICEIGRSLGDQRAFLWDASGHLRKVGGPAGAGGAEQLVVPLNEVSPTLGYLDPPHVPSDRRPRLEISFGVNADRWLWATVQDLRARKYLMEEEPVVRLL
jgi:molecular chaperone DnaK (HSP70)